MVKWKGKGVLGNGRGPDLRAHRSQSQGTKGSGACQASILKHQWSLEVPMARTTAAAKVRGILGASNQQHEQVFRPQDPIAHQSHASPDGTSYPVPCSLSHLCDECVSSDVNDHNRPGKRCLTSQVPAQTTYLSPSIRYSEWESVTVGNPEWRQRESHCPTIFTHDSRRLG